MKTIGLNKFWYENLKGSSMMMMGWSTLGDVFPTPKHDHATHFFEKAQNNCQRYGTTQG
jgi:hypothetical protein